MKRGFTLVEIMIVVAIIGLLAAIAIPSFMRARASAQANACINNLRLIEAAKDQFAIEEGKDNGTAVTWEDIGPTAAAPGGYLKNWPVCPSSGEKVLSQVNASNSYTLSNIGTDPICIKGGTNTTLPHTLPTSS